MLHVSQRAPLNMLTCAEIIITGVSSLVVHQSLAVSLPLRMRERCARRTIRCPCAEGIISLHGTPLEAWTCRSEHTRHAASATVLHLVCGCSHCVGMLRCHRRTVWTLTLPSMLLLHGHGSAVVRRMQYNTCFTKVSVRGMEESIVCVCSLSVYQLSICGDTLPRILHIPTSFLGSKGNSWRTFTDFCPCMWFLHIPFCPYVSMWFLCSVSIWFTLLCSCFLLLLLSCIHFIRRRRKGGKVDGGMEDGEEGEK